MKQASDMFTMDMFPELLPERCDVEHPQIVRCVHLPGPLKQVPPAREKDGYGSRNS